MGPKPASIEGETATVGDVAVICAAVAHDEPVAVVDAEGLTDACCSREDLLEPVRSDVGRENRFDAREALGERSEDKEPSRRGTG